MAVEITMQLKLINSSVISVISLILCCQSLQGDKDAVALVNRRAIPMETFENALSRLGHFPGKDFTQKEPRLELLKELIDEELLFQAALKEKVAEKSPRLHRELAKEFLNLKIGKEKYEPTQEEVLNYFENKKNELERIRASHILIKPDKPGDELSEKRAKEKANSILDIIRRQGNKADFANLAKKYSQDAGNKNSGGDLFFFTREKMVPEFSQAAFSLKKVGDVSDVIKTQFGYHIIKLTGEQRGLDFFSQTIKRQIALTKQKERAEKMMEELRASASIKILEEKVVQAKGVPPLPKVPTIPSEQQK